MLKRLLVAVLVTLAICPIVLAQEIPALGFNVAIDTHGRIKPVQTATFGTIRNLFNRGINLDMATVVAIEKNVPLGFAAIYNRQIADNAFWSFGLYGAATGGSIQGGVLTGLTFLIPN